MKSTRAATAPAFQHQLKIPKTASLRTAFRQRQKRRVQHAPTLAEAFPRLKSVKVDVEYSTPDSATRIGHIKYVLNVHHASSLFYFECPNWECVRGDFDLSEVLAAAVAARLRSVTGEVRCHGWRSSDTIKKAYCRTLLRYRLRLDY